MDNLTIHYIFMFTAFALLMPIATIITRYFKVTPNQDFPRVLDNKFWWYSHLIMQISATILMTIALYVMVRGEFNSMHSKLGLLTATLVYLQVLSGLLRGSKGSKTQWGDHYNMSKRRRVFEFYHKTMGWLILALSVITMIIGFVLIDAYVPLFMVVALWVLYNYFIADCMGKERHVDTWKAIWGEKHD